MRTIWAVTLAITIGASACASGGSSQRAGGRSGAGDQKYDPLYSLTLMRQGSTLLQQDRYGDALEKFREASEIAPGNATVQNMIGLCHLKLGNLDEALSAFNDALELIPSFTDARNNRGVTYLALEQYRLAEVDFLAVLGDPTYPHRWEAYYNLGTASLQLGQLGAAADNFRRAVTAPNPVFEAYLRLAEIAADQGRDDEAIDLLEEAHLTFPERIEATLALGRQLTESGHTAAARPYLQEVIAKAPGSDGAREAALLLQTP